MNIFPQDNPEIRTEDLLGEIRDLLKAILKRLEDKDNPSLY